MCAALRPLQPESPLIEAVLARCSRSAARRAARRAVGRKRSRRGSTCPPWIACDPRGSREQPSEAADHQSAATGGAASRPRSSRPRRRWQARMAARAAAAWSSGMGAPFLPARATPEAALAGVGGDVDGDTKIPAGRACATSARCGQRGGGPTSSQLSRGSQRRQATPFGIRLLLRCYLSSKGGPQVHFALRPQAFSTKVN